MPRPRANEGREEDDDELFLDETQHGGAYGQHGRKASQRVKNMKRKRREDLEEEEYDTDDNGGGDDDEGYRIRKRRSSVRAFLDDMADVADSGEDEDDDYEAEDGFIDDAVTELPKENDRRVPRRPSFLEQKDDQDDVEEMERMIEEKYGFSSQVDRNDEGYDEETTYVQQQALLPSFKDPKLWMVRCETGHEREAAVCLMQKSIDRPELQISSAIALDSLKNFIYVEAQKEAHVVEACKGFRYINPQRIVIVPIKEMVGVVSVKSKPTDISKDTWIRMKIGKYKGDLAKVTDFDDFRQKVTVKLVPRIDLNELADKLAGLEVVKKPFVPPPRLIYTRDAREKNIHVERKRDPVTGEYFEKIAGMMFKDGFLYKPVSMRSINYHDIKPTFDELQRFQQGENGGGDFTGSLLMGDAKRAQFMKGDKILVVKGDLKNMRGIIEKLEEEYVFVRPEIKDLPGTLIFNAKDISKYFETGDHVTVVSGTQEGATGMVTKVDGHILVIVSDASMEEICVPADNVMKSSEGISTANRNKNYSLHDLVLLNDASFGIIIRVDSKAYHVLKGTPHLSQVDVLKHQDINSKIEKMGTAEDKFRNRIYVKDVVSIVEGPFRGKQGSIEQIHKQTVFVKDRKNLEHGGFVCVQAHSCTLLGGLHARRGIQVDSSMDSRVSHSRSSPCIPQSQGRPLLRGDYRRYQSGRRGNDSIVGTTVKVCKGHHKGSRGRVIDVKGQSVRVELESQMKIVTVDRSQISDKLNVTSQRCNTSQYGLGSETPIRYGLGNGLGSETPMRGHDPSGEPGTPIHDGMRTPMRNCAWNPYASMSPARIFPASKLDGGSNSSRRHSNSADIMRSPQLLAGTP